MSPSTSFSSLTPSALARAHARRVRAAQVRAELDAYRTGPERAELVAILARSDAASRAELVAMTGRTDLAA